MRMLRRALFVAAAVTAVATLGANAALASSVHV
jgi:hypothetical protein